MTHQSPRYLIQCVKLQERVEYLESVLMKIANWELPTTGKFWDEEQTRPTSYETENGSNGAREYIKSVALAALNNTNI